MSADLHCAAFTRAAQGVNYPPAECKVYTPFPIARGIVKALGNYSGATWLEPSHGHGVFLRALAEIKVPRDRIHALDLDPLPCAEDSLAHTMRGIDFLEWASKTPNRYDRIIGNPPYLAISQLSPSLRKVAAMIKGFDGLPIGSCSNTWYAFAISAIRLLGEGGSLALILPSAVEYAEYASPLRAAISNLFESLELLRCHRPLFDDVQEGTVVVIARGYKRGRPFRFLRQEFRNRDRLIRRLDSHSTTTLRECPPTEKARTSTALSFGDIAEVRLGGVTGDSKYFLLTESERQRHELPIEACTPVVSKARHLFVPVFSEEDWNALKEDEQRVWLFNPHETSLEYPSVLRYLRRGLEDGCNTSGYKIRNRVPWHSTPLPSRPHGFASGMSRYGPWICLSEYGELNATNTLYTIKFRPEAEGLRFGYALALLCSDVQRQLRTSARRYADGLIKYEPSALTVLRLPVVRSNKPYRSRYCKAVNALLSGKRQLARSIADETLELI